MSVFTRPLIALCQFVSVINWRSSQLCHWESRVKLLQYFGGTLDFKHSYDLIDLQCWLFLSVVGSKTHVIVNCIFVACAH